MNEGIRYDLAYETMPWDEVDTVVFDIGNVLICYAPDNFVLDLFPGDEQTQQDMLKYVYRGEHWLKFDRGVMSYEDAAKMLTEKYGRSEDVYMHAMRGWMDVKTPIEEGWRAARKCKEMGKKIVLLSNYPREGYEFLRRKFGDRFDIFDDACISCYIHQLKPEPEIYQTLKETCGVEAGRAVFIDDTLRNVEGAMKAGIHGFHMHEDGMMDRFFK